MKRRLRLLRKGFVSGQSGQALILVLIFLLLGSLLLVPTLDRLSTASKTGIKYEKKTDALYAADAGIEDGMWQIKYDGLQPKFGGEDYYEYDFTNNATYTLDDPVNGLTTNVTVQNIWIPSDVTLGDLGLSASQAKAMIETNKLVVSGTAGAVAGQPYRIKIDFVPSTGDNLTIKSVGVWLPEGFNFVSGNSTLEQVGHTYTKIPTVTPHCGGQAIVWTYDGSYPLFTDFPNFVSENGTETSTIYFSYTPPASDPTKMPSGIAWVTTQMNDAYGAPKTNDVPISWDVDTRIYKITSIAGGTKVEAYTSKLELRNMGDAASGDYVAVGNSLMIDSDHKPPPDHGVRNQLLSSSSSDVTSVPSNGDVLSAYLYWSGWRNDATSIWNDSCSNFNNWVRSNDSENQTRVPTGDGDISGTWNTSAYWDDVDETTPNDADYVTGTTSGGGYLMFTFSPFTISSSAAISSLTVYVRALKVSSSGSSDIRPYIKVNGTRYYPTSGNNPATSFTTYSYSWTTNPKTGAPWTVADINGSGTNPLQQFGVYSNDLSPNVEVSMVYAMVDLGCWSISSGQFEGQGNSGGTVAERTLTLKNSVNISSYTPGMVAVFWDQSKSGTLASTDALYYAVSADGGTTWSANYQVFHGNSPHSYGSFTVPAGYYTSTFKFRFYFNFDNTSKYIDLDNISVQYVPPDTSITFSINGQQVYLDGDGTPQAGAQPLTASSFSVLMNTTGYSYACHRDVSALVKKYPIVPGEQHHTGNANYTVGGVTATTGNEISYAGWSLVIVYFSPQTAGHYLYLRDVFSYTSGGEDLDFDGDGTPGGDISGFVMPEPIKDKNGVITETNAATLTCFVGEGDWCYAGDYVALNAPDGLRANPTDYTSYESYKLWDGITLTTPTPVNTAANPDNVWNGMSTALGGSVVDGVDIDTFNITWASQLLKPGDTRLHLDMYTQTDNWNIIYFIISVRSKVVTGGTGHYIIMDN
jgi:Tfp pilus assembly protein PilX